MRVPNFLPATGDAGGGHFNYVCDSTFVNYNFDIKLEHCLELIDPHGLKELCDPPSNHLPAHNKNKMVERSAPIY